MTNITQDMRYPPIQTPKLHFSALEVTHVYRGNLLSPSPAPKITLFNLRIQIFNPGIDNSVLQRYTNSIKI